MNNDSYSPLETNVACLIKATNTQTNEIFYLGSILKFKVAINYMKANKYPTSIILTNYQKQQLKTNFKNFKFDFVKFVYNYMDYDPTKIPNRELKLVLTINCNKELNKLNNTI